MACECPEDESALVRLSSAARGARRPQSSTMPPVGLDRAASPLEARISARVQHSVLVAAAHGGRRRSTVSNRYVPFVRAHAPEVRAPKFSRTPDLDRMARATALRGRRSASGTLDPDEAHPEETLLWWRRCVVGGAAAKLIETSERVDLVFEDGLRDGASRAGRRTPPREQVAAAKSALPERAARQRTSGKAGHEWHQVPCERRASGARSRHGPRTRRDVLLEDLEVRVRGGGGRPVDAVDVRALSRFRGASTFVASDHLSE